MEALKLPHAGLRAKLALLLAGFNLVPAPLWCGTSPPKRPAGSAGGTANTHCSRGKQLWRHFVQRSLCRNLTGCKNTQFSNMTAPSLKRFFLLNKNPRLIHSPALHPLRYSAAPWPAGCHRATRRGRLCRRDPLAPGWSRSGAQQFISRRSSSTSRDDADPVASGGLLQSPLSLLFH